MKEEERFWSKVKIATPDECWEWQDFCDKFGYGHFRTRVRMIRSHRYSLQLSVGRTLEPHEYACHKCNNTSCVNPNHLYVGSQKENMQDMSNARTVRGGNNSRSKVTDLQVIRMQKLRQEGMKVVDISNLFGISASQCSRLSRGLSKRCEA